VKEKEKMKSRVYKTVWYIARISLLAVMLGAGALAVIVMRGIPMVGVGCVAAAIAIDLICRHDSHQKRKKGGDTEDDSTGDES